MSDAAEVIAQHRGQLGLLLNGRVLCNCGEKCADEAAWGEHVAEVLVLTARLAKRVPNDNGNRTSLENVAKEFGVDLGVSDE